MKKKRSNTGENHYYIQWGIATLILIVYVLGTLFDYNKTIRELSVDRAIDRISKQAIQIRGYYEGKLAGAEDMAEGIADFVSQEDDIFNENAVKAIDSIVADGDLKKAYIVKPDGSAIDNDREKYDSIDNSEEFQDMIAGKRSLYVKKDSDGETAILVASPISQEHSLKGYVILSYSPNSISNIIKTPIYSYSLVFDDGYVAENLGESPICEVGENLLDSVKSMDFVSGTYSVFSQGISGDRSVTAVVTARDGRNYYLIAQPVENMDSEVIITVSESNVTRKANEDNNITRAMVIKLMISLIIFIVLLFAIYVINRIAFSKTSKELKDKAETDLLTGLLNKVSTENKIREYLKEEGKGKTCMLCVLDIDNFKKINDTMGHSFGDEVLASLGKQIGSEFRVSDIIGRTGGDEFIIFLKDLKDEEIINKEADRIATFFKNFTVGDYTKYAATASIGVALYPRDGEDFETIYKAADTALYKAKNRGKNQMAFYKDR